MMRRRCWIRYEVGERRSIRGIYAMLTKSIYLHTQRNSNFPKTTGHDPESVVARARPHHSKSQLRMQYRNATSWNPERSEGTSRWNCLGGHVRFGIWGDGSGSSRMAGDGRPRHRARDVPYSVQRTGTARGAIGPTGV